LGTLSAFRTVLTATRVC